MAKDMANLALMRLIIFFSAFFVTGVGQSLVVVLFRSDIALNSDLDSDKIKSDTVIPLYTGLISYKYRVPRFTVHDTFPPKCLFSVK